jgi:Zn-dependent protease/CBS domain-containing protein
VSSPPPERPGQPGRSGQSRRPATGAALLRIGSVLGVPVFVTPSWVLVAGYITISYSGFMQDQIPGASRAASYGLSLIFAAALALSVLLHEVGHTVVSRLVGLPVRRIVVFLLGGVSEIEGEASRPRDELAIAAAGPLVSFVLAGGCWAASLLSSQEAAVGVLLLLVAWSNLVIAVFNVLPGLPLDGGRLLQALIWMLGSSRLTGVRIAAWSGRGLAVLLGLAVLAANAILGGDRPATLATVAATAMGFAVAAFLWFGASQTLRVTELTTRAAALQLGHLIRPSIYLPAQTPVSEAVRQAGQLQAAGIVVIDGQGRSRALVDEAQISQLETHRQPWVSLAEVARPLEPGLIIAEDVAGAVLLDTIRAHPASEYLVVGRDGVARGVISAVDLARALGLPRPRQHNRAFVN